MWGLELLKLLWASSACNRNTFSSVSEDTWTLLPKFWTNSVSYIFQYRNRSRSCSSFNFLFRNIPNAEMILHLKWVCFFLSFKTESWKESMLDAAVFVPSQTSWRVVLPYCCSQIYINRVVQMTFLFTVLKTRKLFSPAAKIILIIILIILRLNCNIL
jgi:hypothetical protein